MEISQVLDHLEADLLEKIDEMSAKDYCTFWASVKEFQQAKIQRSTAAPLGDGDSSFTVVHTTNGD